MTFFLYKYRYKNDTYLAYNNYCVDIKTDLHDVK